MNAEERTQLLRLLQYVEYLFGGTVQDWDIDFVDLELNTNYKPFNFKYYPVPTINKGSFSKEIKRLAKIGVLTTVKQSQYSTPAFIIPEKQVL